MLDQQISFHSTSTCMLRLLLMPRSAGTDHLHLATAVHCRVRYRAALASCIFGSCTSRRLQAGCQILHDATRCACLPICGFTAFSLHAGPHHAAEDTCQLYQVVARPKPDQHHQLQPTETTAQSRNRWQQPGVYSRKHQHGSTCPSRAIAAVGAESAAARSAGAD